MNTVRQIQELNKRELEAGVTPEGSWHADYRDTAYIYIGGLPFDLSEGDIITIFSQFGEPVWLKLQRDKETGKSKGFAWLKYEDQRSCDLAVDNFSGATVLGRVLRVDHTRYKPKEGEDEKYNVVIVGEESDEQDERESRRHRKRRRKDDSEDENRPLLKEEKELAELMRDQDDEDPMKAYLIKQKKEEVAQALKALKKSRRKKDHGTERHKHRSRREHRSRSVSDDERRQRYKRDRSTSRERRHSKDRTFTSHRDRSTSVDRRARRPRERSVSGQRYGRTEKAEEPADVHRRRTDLDNGRRYRSRSRNRR